MQKLFYIQSGGPASIYTVDPAIQTVLQADKGVDHRYLEGWNRFAVVAAQTAVAAQFSRVRIRNPVASNVIIVLEQLSVFESTADNPLVTWGATVTDLATLISLTFTRMDPRGNPQPSAIISVNAQAAGGQALLQRPLSSGTVSQDFINNPNQEIPILPGQVVDIQAGIVNLALFATLMWRERVLEASELT